MNKKIIIGAIIIAAIVIIYFVSKSYQMPQGGAKIPASGQQNQAPAAGGNNVAIQNFAFDPAVLAVKAGDTVTWTNDDSAPHQIKSDAFNSLQLAKGQTFSFIFPSAGTFDYSCAIHPSMKGQIVVQ